MGACDKSPAKSRDWRKASRGIFTVDLPPDGFYVYIAWGLDDNRPLYVGKSSGLIARLGRHSNRSPWWRHLHHLEVYQYGSDLEALWAEGEAIHDLQPAYNQVGVKAVPAITRYMRRRPTRSQLRPLYGPPITTEQIPRDQLDIIARVQNRK